MPECSDVSEADTAGLPSNVGSGLTLEVKLIDSCRRFRVILPPERVAQSAAQDCVPCSGDRCTQLEGLRSPS